VAVTAASFKARFEEFAEAGDALIDGCLDDARAQLGETIWGSLYDQAVSLRAAHMLALSPFGLGLQIGVRRNPERSDTSDVGSTVYEEQYLRLCRKVAVGGSVSGA
jgi:hypothetical protein